MSGQVTNLGKPTAFAQMRLLEHRGGFLQQTSYKTKTDANGFYRIDKVSPGIYRPEFIVDGQFFPSDRYMATFGHLSSLFRQPPAINK